MGRVFAVMVHQDEELELSGALEQAGNTHIGEDIGKFIGAGKYGVKVSDNPEGVISASDTIIDFTTPESTLACAEIAVAMGKAHIIGTTGMSEAQKEQLRHIAKAEKNVIVQAGNFSVGVNIMQALVEKTAELTSGYDFDIEVLEMHHKHKVDAPSGTSLMMGEAAAGARGLSLRKVARYERHGRIGEKPQDEIGFASLRGGGVFGDHTVIFSSEDERIEISHKAGNRMIFASGAIAAAKWSADQPAGYYTMRDVLGL